MFTLLPLSCFLLPLHPHYFILDKIVIPRSLIVLQLYSLASAIVAIPRIVSKLATINTHLEIIVRASHTLAYRHPHGDDQINVL